MNNSNAPGFIVAGAVNHLRRWRVCVCKENIITGSMTPPVTDDNNNNGAKRRTNLACARTLALVLYYRYKYKCRIFSLYIYFVRKRVLCMSHFIYYYIYCILLYYIFFPGRFEQTARRTYGTNGRTRIGRRALPVQNRTFQKNRYRQVSHIEVFRTGGFSLSIWKYYKKYTARTANFVLKLIGKKSVLKVMTNLNSLILLCHSN